MKNRSTEETDVVEEIEVSRRRFVTGAGAASVGLTVALLPSAVAAASGPGGDGDGGGGGPFDDDLSLTMDPNTGMLSVIWNQGPTPGPFNYSYSYSYTPPAASSTGTVSGSSSSNLNSNTSYDLFQLPGGSTITITFTSNTDPSQTFTRTFTHTGPQSFRFSLLLDQEENNELRIRWSQGSFPSAFTYDYTFSVSGGQLGTTDGNVSSGSGSNVASGAQPLLGNLPPGATITVVAVTNTTPTSTMTRSVTNNV